MVAPNIFYNKKVSKHFNKIFNLRGDKMTLEQLKTGNILVERIEHTKRMLLGLKTSYSKILKVQVNNKNNTQIESVSDSIDSRGVDILIKYYEDELIKLEKELEDL